MGLPTKSSRQKDKSKSTKKKKDIVNDDEMDQLEEQLSALSDKAHTAQYASMFRKLRKMISNQEDKCLQPDQVKNGDFYVLNNLYSQMRELINDIRTIVDMTGQVNALIDGVIHPLSSSNAQLIVDAGFQIKRIIKEYTKGETSRMALKDFDKVMLEIARGLQNNNNNAQASVKAILLEPAPQRKRKRI